MSVEPNETNLNGNAVSLLIAGKPEEAAAMLRSVCTDRNTNPAHWFAFGSALANTHDNSGAEQAFKRALDAGPDSPRIFDALIMALISQGAHEQALEPLQLFLSLRPGQPVTKLRLVTVLTRLNRFSQAQAVCDEISEIQPDNIEVMFRKAEIAMLTGRMDETIQLLDEILARNPAAVAALMNKGLALQKTGKLDEAIQQFRRATSANPNLDNAWYTLGLALLGKGEKNQALECFEKSFRINPANLAAGDQLARTYGLLGRTDDARKVYEMILKAHPENARARFYLDAYSNDGQPARIPADVIGPVCAAKDAGRNFDQALVNSMDYRTPEILNNAVRESLRIPDEGLDIMELGCGSGLCGSRFSDIAHRLVGTDISTSMLEAARGKHVYDELYEADLVDVLSSNPSAFDLVLATDVLCFFGDLTDIFRMCHDTLRSSGAFGFTVEKPQGDELFTLNSEGYFYHSLTHLRAVASRTGFEEVYAKESILRTEIGIDRVGYICLFRRD